MDHQGPLSTTVAELGAIYDNVDVVVNGQQKEEGERNVSSPTTVQDDTQMPNSG